MIQSFPFKLSDHTALHTKSIQQTPAVCRYSDQEPVAVPRCLLSSVCFCIHWVCTQAEVLLRWAVQTLKVCKVHPPWSFITRMTAEDSQTCDDKLIKGKLRWKLNRPNMIALRPLVSLTQRRAIIDTLRGNEVTVIVIRYHPLLFIHTQRLIDKSTLCMSRYIILIKQYIPWIHF